MDRTNCPIRSFLIPESPDEFSSAWAHVVACELCLKKLLALYLGKEPPESLIRFFRKYVAKLKSSSAAIELLRVSREEPEGARFFCANSFELSPLLNRLAWEVPIPSAVEERARGKWPTGGG